MEPVDFNGYGECWYLLAVRDCRHMPTFDFRPESCRDCEARKKCGLCTCVNLSVDARPISSPADLQSKACTQVWVKVALDHLFVSSRTDMEGPGLAIAAISNAKEPTRGKRIVCYNISSGIGINCGVLIWMFCLKRSLHTSVVR
jgi:hypothetical protein